MNDFVRFVLIMIDCVTELASAAEFACYCKV